MYKSDFSMTLRSHLFPFGPNAPQGYKNGYNASDESNHVSRLVAVESI